MKPWRRFTCGLIGVLAWAVRSPALDWQATTQAVTTAPFQLTVETAFEFRNTGTHPVTIRDLQTSCECLDATSDRKIFPPGESGVIHARFTVGDRIGTYERIVTVVTDEAGSPVRLLLKIEVPAVATLTPRSVAWQKDESGAEKSIELTAAPDLEIIFAEALPTNDAFSARLETVDAGKHYRLHLKPRDPTKPASAAVRLFGHEKSGHDVVLSAYASVQ